MQNASPIRRFLTDTSGAVTVDWVVLTAAIVGLALGVVFVIDDATTALGDKIAHLVGYHVHPGS